MIDIHTHILPGVDDGAWDMEEALAMAELAVECGVQSLVATPHAGRDTGERERKKIRTTLEEFRGQLARRQIPLRVYSGMEILAFKRMGEGLKSGELFSLNHSRYCMIEFPFQAEPAWMGDCLEEVLEQGKIPVIAHPERYICVQRTPSLIFDWVRLDCQIQVNKGSFFGRFGKHACRTAERLLEYGLITCVASDAHSPYKRTTYLGDIREYLRDQAGERAARELLSAHPEDILLDRKIEISGRIPGRYRRIF